MLKSKTFDRICCAAIAVMLAITAVLWVGKVKAGRQIITLGYEDLFNQDRVHEINIEMDEEDWDAFIKRATAEEYVECTVTIDGERMTNVAIRAKGNTSLSSVSSLGSEKYSFKIEFDQYDSGKKYHGLDKLSLNNLIYDATMMKDYLAYTLMAKMDVPSPLCSFAAVSVNGEYFGLYLAVEGIEDSFLSRNSMTGGELYKPDSMSFGGGRGNGGDFDIDVFRTEEDENEESGSSETSAPASENAGGSSGSSSGAPASSSDDNNGFGRSSGDRANESDQDEGFGDSSGASSGESNMPDPSSEDFDPAAMMGDMGGFGGMFNFGMGNGDVKLQYSDDDPDSYSNIFNNAKTDISKWDKERLIESLRKLNAREDLEDVVFADEVINYLVVHDFVRNGDSYTGSMVHNYYLYEEEGHLAILPWDYNLGFGGFTGGTNGKSTVNSSIYSPVDGSVDDRPLVAWIFHDDDALKAYEAAYTKFINDYIFSGWGKDGTEPLTTEIDRVAALIRPYVETDPEGFFSVDEFDVAIDTMKEFCDQRGQSVRDQLAGKSTSELNYGNGLNLSAMGAMNTGGGNRDDMGSGDSRGGPANPAGNEPTTEEPIKETPEVPESGEPSEEPIEQETQESSGPVQPETSQPGEGFGNSSGAPAGNGTTENSGFGDSSGAPAGNGATEDSGFGDSSGAPAGNGATEDSGFGDSSGMPAGNGTTEGMDFGDSSGMPANAAASTAPTFEQPKDEETPETSEAPVTEEPQEEASESEAPAEVEASQPEGQNERERSSRNDEGFGGSNGGRSGDDDGFGPSSGGPGSGEGMPEGPGGGMGGGPWGEQSGSNSSGMSWGEFGFYALLLLAAIVLVSLVKGHNR
ncbi:MAG: CotH kinase family protein [Clostridia bacterium]|nr:CotH kinase family protein [Clostridia bacterium]